MGPPDNWELMDRRDIQANRETVELGALWTKVMMMPLLCVV